MTTVSPRDAHSIDAEVAGLVQVAIESSGTRLNRLAEATGIPRTTLKRKLDGSSSFTVVELIRIASALNVPNDAFIAPLTGAEVA